MSIPISHCQFIKAAKDDIVFENFAQAMAINLKCGHYTASRDCDHNPKCKELSDDELNKLIDRLEKRIFEINPKLKDKFDE